jgi:ribonuclease VapC
LIVLDSSAILAEINGEPGQEVVSRHRQTGVMSTVNFSEVLSKLSEQPQFAGIPPVKLLDALVTIPFDRKQAIIAGELRPRTRHLGLSFGDRACLALAMQRNSPVLTADRKWASLNLGIEIKLIR